jgi:hypothetical protein
VIATENETRTGGLAWGSGAGDEKGRQRGGPVLLRCRLPGALHRRFVDQAADRGVGHTE